MQPGFCISLAICKVILGHINMKEQSLLSEYPFAFKIRILAWCIPTIDPIMLAPLKYLAFKAAMG